MALVHGYWWLIMVNDGERWLVDGVNDGHSQGIMIVDG